MARRSAVREVAAQRYWREGQARVVVEAWRRSGESLAAFARAHGIGRRRLERWARRLGVTGGGIRFHRVQLVERRGSASDARGGGAPIEIEGASGRRVRVFPGFAAEDLGRVLEVLEGRQKC
jgi:transposase-like protein